MRFLHGTELTAGIRTVVTARPVDMAVAFWGDKAVERLALPDDLSGYRIACDARSGACSPTALTELLERGALVVDVPGLHAKVYWSPRRMVVGSANASTNGLAEDAEVVAGLEAGIWTDDIAAIDKAHGWFKTILQGRNALRPVDLKEVAELWDRRRRGRPLRTTTLAEALLSNSQALTERSERVYVYTTEEAPEAVKRRYRESEAFDEEAWEKPSLPFFWGDIPGFEPDQTLLCFEIEGRAFRWEGVWHVHDRLPGKGTPIWPAREIDRLFGMPHGDMREVTRRARAAVRAGRLPVDGPRLPLSQFAAALLPSFADDHLARIQAESIRDAYRLLISETPRLGLSPSPKSGVLPAIRFHDGQNRYVFSFNVNRRDLLFYLRDRALTASPGLVARAEQAGFAIEVPRARVARDKPKTERQIRLFSSDDARRLIAWLATELPLPG